MLTDGVEGLRLSLHVLAAAVWVGGQITLLGLLPVLRRAGGDVPKEVARQFHRIAWPAFALALVTGVWNLLEVPSGRDAGYDAVLMAKLVAVALTGLAAWLHANAATPAARGAWGGVGFVGAVAALVLGVFLSG